MLYKGQGLECKKLIKAQSPYMYDVECICHLADLAVKAGLQALPVIDVFYWFHHSRKRKQQFVDHWCSLFTDKPSTILKHYPACWLSLLKCVNRYLSQYQGLQSYFLSFEEAETVKVRSIVSIL